MMTEDQLEQEALAWLGEFGYDTLLPRPISGQLRLPEAGALIDAA
jgi:hypothetical protein